MPSHPLPEIIAHRGASADRHENSLAAFGEALAQQADGIELDVHATADGAVVVHHDPVVHATGLPPGSDPLVIARSPLAVIRASPLCDGSPIPTLDEVCALVAERAILYVEVKAEGLERLVPAILARYPTVRAAVHSFDHRVAAAMRGSVPSGVLLSSYLIDLPGAARAAGARDVWMAERLIDEACVTTLHASGHRLIAWTVDDAARARELHALRVDGLCTNRPALVREALESADA